MIQSASGGPSGVLGVFQGISEVSYYVSRGIRSIPGRFRDVPGDLSSVPMGFRDVSGSFSKFLRVSEELTEFSRSFWGLPGSC